MRFESGDVREAFLSMAARFDVEVGRRDSWFDCALWVDAPPPIFLACKDDLVENYSVAGEEILHEGDITDVEVLRLVMTYGVTVERQKRHYCVIRIRDEARTVILRRGRRRPWGDVWTETYTPYPLKRDESEERR